MTRERRRWPFGSFPPGATPPTVPWTHQPQFAQVSMIGESLSFLTAQPALDGEQVEAWWPANRTQGWRAVGGALFLTSHRLVHCPNVIETRFKGHPWAIARADVVDLQIAPRAPRAWIRPFDGGLRPRLRVIPSVGEPTLFVINRLPQALRTIRGSLYG